MKLCYWNLRSGSRSSLRSVARSLCSAERREDPICVGSNFFGSLTTNLPSGCWVVCVLKCCSQACCCAVMEDCSTASTSQKRLSLFSRLVSSRSNNCVVSHSDVMTGVGPENVQPNTLPCSTGWPGRVGLPDSSISQKRSASNPRSMSPNKLKFSSAR